MTEITDLLNPHLFTVTVHKVRPMYRPKFYLAAVQIKDRVRLLRDNTRYKTHTAAREHGNKVMARWCRLYDAAILALSTPIPAVPPMRESAELGEGSSPIPAEA